MKPKPKKSQEPEPKKQTPSEEKKMSKLVKEVEEFNPEFVEYLKKKGLVKG